MVIVPIADSTDQWDGFPAARRRLIESLSKVSDPVVFTGDIHQHCAAEIQSESGQPVGVELVATSIASDGDGFAGSKSTEWLEKPYVKAMDKRRGYIKVRASREHLDSEFVVVPWIERDDTAPRETAFSFRTNAGEHTLRSL